MAHGNQTNSTPNNGNPMEIGTVKGDSVEVRENSSPITIPIQTSSNQELSGCYSHAFWGFYEFIQRKGH